MLATNSKQACSTIISALFFRLILNQLPSEMKGNRFAFIQLITGILILIACQAWYTQATPQAINWLLLPTTKLVALFTGADYYFRPNIGYIFNQPHIAIGITCSGFTFLMICITMLYFQFNKYYTRWSKLFFLLFIIIISYPITLLMNCARILSGILGQRIGDLLLEPKPHLILHQCIGLLVYFICLIIIHKLAINYFSKHQPNEQSTTT